MGQITELLRERHRIAPGDEDDFVVHDFTEVLNAVQATVGSSPACCSASP